MGVAQDVVETKEFWGGSHSGKMRHKADFEYTCELGLSLFSSVHKAKKTIKRTELSATRVEAKAHYLCRRSGASVCPGLGLIPPSDLVASPAIHPLGSVINY
jgi:hypothetical protein